jgi:hypothetical protein
LRRESSIGDAFADVLFSGWGICLQIVMIALLFGLTLINWERLPGTMPRDD